jgi:multidrug efflux pump subunit AcrA (membrane-fusion protein)
MKLWKTAIVVVAIVGVTAGALAIMVKGDGSEEISKPDEPIWNVRTTSASLGAYSPQIKLIGQVEPVKDLSEVALLSAQVISVNFTDGMRVNAGDTLLQLDDFDAQLQLQQTQADLADLDSRIILQASAQELDIQALKVEKASLALLEKQVAKQKAISNTQASIDDLNQQIQRQQFSVLQRESAIKNHPANNQQLSIQKQKLKLALSAAERNVSNAKLVAPFDGKLAQVFVKEGQRVNPGAPLYRLYSENEMSVLVQLPPRLLANKEILTGTAYEQGRVSQLSYNRSEAQLNPGQSGFKAWFDLSQDEQWLPGDIAYLTLNIAAKEQTFQIPASSVFQDRWVYSVDEEQRLKAVEIIVLGSTSEGNANELVVQTKYIQGVVTQASSLRLLTTRLNNPTTGMKVYEEGVDPEPEVPAEDDAENSEDDTDEEDGTDEDDDENA